MSTPCKGLLISHLQHILQDGEGHGVLVGPDVVEQGENIHVEVGLKWKLSKKKVKGGGGGGLADLQKPSKDLVVEDGDGLHVG